jgi:hypothetical protein
MKFLPSFANWRSGILPALTRFPWNILCGLSGAAAMIVSLRFSKNEVLVGQCVRLVMTVALGMPLFFSLRMLRERHEQLRRWPIEIIGLPSWRGGCSRYRHGRSMGRVSFGFGGCCFWRHCIFSSPFRHTFGGPRIRAFGSLIANCFCVFVSPLFTRASSLLVWN